MMEQPVDHTPTTKTRKDDHIRINLEEKVTFNQRTSGFERYFFMHNALPELDLNAIDCTQSFFGRQMRLPLLISSMTGGTAEAAIKLIQSVEGEIIECCFVIDLPDLGGVERLKKLGCDSFALCRFDGD